MEKLVSSKAMRIVMLCGNGFSSKAMYNGLRNDVVVERVILEDKPSSKTMIQRRIKRLGLLKTAGQLFFIVANKLLSRTTRSESEKLISAYGLKDVEIPDDVIMRVGSINDDKVMVLLKEIDPDAVVVNGTRIISKKVLSSVSVPFINTHMGITPKYRGVHGGYWALANGDKENCGVTVHLVDEGIDTGGVLYQEVIHPSSHDNFNTYPIHQIAKAIPLMKKALKDVQSNALSIQPGIMPSQLYYHPTLLEYFKNWVVRGVR